MRCITIGDLDSNWAHWIVHTEGTQWQWMWHQVRGSNWPNQSQNPEFIHRSYFRPLVLQICPPQIIGLLVAKFLKSPPTFLALRGPILEQLLYYYASIHQAQHGASSNFPRQNYSFWAFPSLGHQHNFLPSFHNENGIIFSGSCSFNLQDMRVLLRLLTLSPNAYNFVWLSSFEFGLIIWFISRRRF